MKPETKSALVAKFERRGCEGAETEGILVGKVGVEIPLRGKLKK